MLNGIGGSVPIAALAGLTSAVALTAAVMSVKLYLSVPANWLCDYGEKPQRHHSTAMRCGGEKGQVARSILLLAVFMAAAMLLKWQLTSAGAGGFASLFDADATAGEIYAALREVALFSAAFVILGAAALSDLEYMIIPDQAWAGILVVAALRWLSDTDGAAAGILTAAAGGAAAAGLMLAAALISLIFCGTAGVGAGDAKLMTACGVLCGGSSVFILYILTVMPSAVYFACRLVTRRSEAGDAQPLAPWIAGAAMICLAL